jgi:hypothetical protein
MLKYVSFALLALVLVVAGVAWAGGFATAAAANACCVPGAECCYPGSPCCTADCCAQGAECCPDGDCCTGAAAALAEDATAVTATDGSCCPDGVCCPGACCVE